MARPFKSGLSYFPWDVEYKRDAKIRKLRYQYGPLGFTIYLDVLAMVYSEGYYLEMDIDSLAECVAMEIGSNFVKIEKVKEVIHACADIGLFEYDLMCQGVITSSSIQKQFILSTKRRQNINIDKYWLLDLATMSKLKVLFDMPKEHVNSNINLDNVNNKSFNVCNSTQKEKEIDKIDKIIDKREFGIPKYHFFTKSLIENGYINQYDLEYYKYNNLFKELVDIYGFEKLRSVVWYLVSYSKRTTTQIDNKYMFFKASIINNLDQIEKREERGNETIDEYFRRKIQEMDK